MKKMLFFFFTLLTTSLIYGQGQDSMQSLTEANIKKLMIKNKIPALGLGVIKNGKIAEIKVIGKHQKGLKAPQNTIFNVASLTKPITAMVTLKLASVGKWDIDEPIYKFWIDPDLINNPDLKKLTTRHILSHQSGFKNWRRMNKSKKLEFDFEPGTKYQYSGEGMEYLKIALERKFGQTLDQLAYELIFSPLKMTDTQFFWTNKTDSTRFAIGYDKKGNAYKTIKNKKASGADDLLTTIEDYSKFLISFFDEKTLSQATYNEMVKPQVKTKKNKYFGLGLEIYYLENDEIALSHGGSDEGVQTIFFILPKTKEGLIIFTNVDDGYKIYEELIKSYLGKKGTKIFEIETK